MKYISSKKSIICCTNIQNINQNPTLANNTCALYANIYGMSEFPAVLNYGNFERSLEVA